jgi:hypothetical protein
MGKRTGPRAATQRTGNQFSQRSEAVRQMIQQLAGGSGPAHRPRLSAARPAVTGREANPGCTISLRGCLQLDPGFAPARQALQNFRPNDPGPDPVHPSATRPSSWPPPQLTHSKANILRMPRIVDSETIWPFSPERRQFGSLRRKTAFLTY